MNVPGQRTRAVIEARQLKGIRLESKRPAARNRRITRFAWIVAAAFGALALTACGSEGGSDSVPAAQPTAGTAPTLEPTSDNETVFARDFELPRAGGGTVKLSDVYSGANTVLVFYRGYF